MRNLQCAKGAAPRPNLDYGEWLRSQDLAHGVIRLDESIGDRLTQRILGEISELKRRKPEKITLVISSPGGGAYNAFAIYDALRDLSTSGVTITGIVVGWAASAACMIILQAADNRVARKHARFLMHETRRWVFWAVERTSDLKDEILEMDKLTDMILELLSKRCGRSIDEIRERIERKEIWMSATEALQWGLIDAVE